MSENKEIKQVVEQYCPIVCHNVVVEVKNCGYKEACQNCLELHHCEKERGGCTNKYFSSKQSK